MENPIVKKNVLITGAHGFLGRYCAAEFSRQGYRVVGVGHGAWNDDAAAEAGIDVWLEGDISFERLASMSCNPDIIVHAAGSGTVSFSLSHPKQDFERSVSTTLAVLEYARLANHAPRIVLISSAAVYGCAEEVHISEGTPMCPTSPYGVHKRMSEQLCSSYGEHFGVESSIIRLFSVYGPGLKKQLLWEACRKMCAAGNSERLDFFGTGSETRDWIHAKDAALLVRLVGEYAHADIVVNGGSGQAVAVRDILKGLAVEMGCRGRVAFNDIVRKGDPGHLCADNTRAVQLGWSPTVQLSAGLADYAAWFRGLV